MAARRCDGAEHNHTWIRTGQEVRTAITVDGDGEWVVGGLKELVILKSTGSEFAGFLTDPYTVLEPTHDRVMATSLVAQWRFTTPAGDWQVAWDEVYAGVKGQLVKQFAVVQSLALQQTLYEWARPCWRTIRPSRVRLSAPNKHHFVYDLSKFLQNNNEVFHADDRLYGLIQATVTRHDAPAPDPAGICSRNGWPDLQLLKISNTDCRRNAIGRKVRNRLSSQPKLENVIDGQGEELPAARALRTQGLYLDVSHSTKYPYSD